MAQFDQQNTTLLDLTGREPNDFSQPSQGGSSPRTNEDADNQTAGGSEQGKGAESLPRKPSPTPLASLNTSDHVDRPDTLAVPSPSPSSSSPASAVASTPARPNLVQSHSQSHSASTAAHPKKFCSVNINKKFLEKNTSASTMAATTTSTSTSAKASGSTISRPPIQSSSPHPRLVTTKLTATTSSPSSAPGWSRPSSTGPSATATGANSPSAPTPAPSVPSNPPTSTSAPAPTVLPLPNAGKLIQPVPRSALTQQHAAATTASSKENGSNNSSTHPGKPVWGNLKQPSTTSARPDVTVNDFPTAAEVAQGMRKGKPGDQPAKDVAPALSTASDSKRNEEADTFRGVHLDPNAHHWDEMVEDDDNYWDNVIEFGDGRQYKVEAVEQSKSKSREPSPPISVKSSHSTRLESVDVPVSKAERFGDDFDRSWPGGPKRAPPTGVQQRSPQEPPRVLFNERSNKLEPYNNHRLGHSYPGKRSSFHERNMSPTETRSGSGFYHHGPPRTAGGPSDFGSNRSRRFSNASNSSFVPPNERDRRDRRDAVPSSPHIAKDHVALMGRTASLRGGDRDGERDMGTLERGRHSTMGPPPIPAHAWRSSSKESTKPHLPTPVSANGPASPFSASGRRFPSGDSGFSHQNGQPDFPGPSPIARGQPHSPALSHASTKAAWISPATSSLPLPALDGHDLEEIKKDVMHNAAERAKQRRQQEEEEREAQKERARKKAAELEAKMKAEAEEKAQKEEAAAREQEEREAKEQASTSAQKEAEVLAIITEAVGGEELSDAGPQLQRTTSKPAHRRGPGQSDPLQPRRFSSTGGLPTSPSVAETVDTWRRATPLPCQSDEPRLMKRQSSNSAAFLPPPPPAPLDHVQTLPDGKKEELEVVDFSDMGKLVGGSIDQKEASRKGSRPVASDFFGDLPSPALPPQPLSPSVRNDIETWRRKTPLNQGPSSEQAPSTDRRDVPQATESPVAEQVHKSNEVIADTRQPNVSPSSNQQRFRPQNHYHQAPISSLVDAMSRIKGAINNMHAEEMNRDNIDTNLAPQSQTLAYLPSKFKERLGPHSQRGKRVENQEEGPEDGYTTAVEPPQSPPLQGTSNVKLPSVSRQRESIQRRRLYMFTKPPTPVQFEILSFDPPVDGMTKRSLSLNDVLFRPIPTYKGKTRYPVHLPKSSRNTGTRSHNLMQTGVRINNFGAFGKQNGADSATSWRKPASQPLQTTDNALEAIESTSRSPPPEPESLPRNDKQGEPSSAENSTLPRTRSQPKMPEGSCVAFYRDSRVDVPDTKPKIVVNFIVSSEIDDPHGSQSQEIKRAEDEAPTEPSRSSEPIKEINEGRTEAQKNNDIPVPKPTNDALKITPPAEPNSLPLSSVSEKNSDKQSHQSSPWPTTKNLPLKESPARAPDPEHLKAVWSQTSNDKAGLQPVNSLEGIADDLTSLPFMLHDVKSEDGETPPPPPSGPSSMRMSLHDVTRAFQQVPVPSSSSTAQKPSISPPSTTAPVARPAMTNFSYPVPPNNMRPAYPGYPSPMMSHSPSPTMMYPHVVSSPVPTRMQPNGHVPIYNPPPPGMWVTVQPSPGQNSNGVMRPMASPYAATIMPYSTNGAATIYPPQAMPAVNVPGTPQSQNLQANRNRNVPVMSPVMQHAGAPPPGMYPASPAMMHLQMTPTSGYIPLPAGRGQPRPENGQMAMQQSNSAHQPPTTHVNFSPVPPSPFMRTW